MSTNRYVSDIVAFSSNKSAPIRVPEGMVPTQVRFLDADGGSPTWSSGDATFEGTTDDTRDGVTKYEGGSAAYFACGDSDLTISSAAKDTWYAVEYTKLLGFTWLKLASTQSNGVRAQVAFEKVVNYR